MLKRNLIVSICLLSIGSMALFYSCTPQVKNVFTISRNSVLIGDSVELKWDIPTAKSVSISSVGSNLSKQGKCWVKADSNSVYKLVAEPENNKKASSVVLRTNLNIRPISLEFTGPTFGTDEGFCTYNWDAADADYVHWADSTTALPAKGSITLKLDKTSSFTIVAENKFGKKRNQTITTSISLNEDLTFPTKVFATFKAPILWSFKKTKYVEITGYGKFNAIDTLVLTPEKSVDLMMKVYRNNDSVEQKQIQITVLPPKIKVFGAPDIVLPGEEFKIAWSTEGAREVWIDKLADKLQAVGQIKQKITSNQKYTLHVKSGSIESSATIVVELYVRRWVKNLISFMNLKKGKRIDMEIFAVDRSNYPKEIKLYIVAVDEDGNFVNNLAPPAIKEKEARKHFVKLVETIAGKAVSIENFKVEMVEQNMLKSNDIAMVLDHSGSMWGRAIDSLQKAATAFIANKNKSDQISVVKFDNKLKTVSELEIDKDSILKRCGFNKLKGFGGSTALYAGGSEGLFSLKNARNNKMMILFTDGEENSSAMYSGNWATTANMLAQEARKNKTRVYVMSIGGGTNEKALRKLADYTDGKFYRVGQTDDVINALREIPTLLRRFYVITYKPAQNTDNLSVELEYNNNKNKTAKTKKEVQVTDNFNFTNLDIDTTAYWYPAGKHISPVGPPQVFAFFEFDRDEIEKTYLAEIKNLADFLRTNRLLKIIVYGHTDQKGAEAYCNELSKKRAKSFERLLISLGIDKDRIETKGMGRQHPVWDAEDTEWKAHENRRLEVLIYQ